MTEESAVKVCVRVRPLIQREVANAENAEPVTLHWNADKQAVHQVDDGNVTKTFSFDRVFSAEESTSQLYQDIAKPLVVSAVEGYNGTIFAYGQTASGKTFTMMGSNRIPGVIPLAMEDVFQTIKNCPKKEFLLRVSYMEIYNETVTDLLCDSWKRKPLEIREGNYKNVYVADLTEELVTSAEQALAWIRKGETNRHYGKTKMNQRSSRSHAIFRMILESREKSDPASGENADGAIIVSHLNLVDLAGSERTSQTGAEGARFKEGCNINRSLLTLGQVIKKLTDESQGGYINYRDSKLTRILQNSLGGNAKTVIICTITPAAVEETLSTLQFASAAKRMKNDPHVTEVSDDGALLRRYRNEIVDLKRRLQEVSSVTQTTVTEKEVLAQLLQEKEQLQREQQDRIKNLTRIIVTSSNFVAAEKKVPKRRVTWGGKLFRPAPSGSARMGDLEFASFEPLIKKRKADLSMLSEQEEDGSGEFDSQWDEDLFDMEMNQSNVTLRSLCDGDFSSPGRVSELCDKVASLELQLHMEAQQKQEAVERSTSLEKKVADLEKQLEVQEESAKDSQEEQCKKDLSETIQLCEMLVSEKNVIAGERDGMKQELCRLMDVNQVLRREKDNLLKEVEEKSEMQEFSALELESTKQYEVELLAEISNLKMAAEKSVACIQKLEADMAAMSALLKQREDLVKELHHLNGRDLVEENRQLRQSLADAEALSRDTKKEWAFLRSDNLSLKERDSSMTTDYERMKNEVTTLSSKLEAEKSRYKKMQADLQKELQGAFEENTKLTTLLDGKVPKNLIDSIELERRVADLKKELEAHQEQEDFLQAQLVELEALKDLPVQVESLKKQNSDLTEELGAAQAERGCLLSAQSSSDAEIHRLTSEVRGFQDQLAETQAQLRETEMRESHLCQQTLDITKQADEFKAEVERLEEEKCHLLNSVEELNINAERSRERESSVEGKLSEQQLLIEDLEKKLVEYQDSSKHAEDHFPEISEQHNDQIKQLTEELQQVCSERDALQSERTNAAHLSEEEQEKLRSHITSLTEERDQLQEILEGVREERRQLKKDLQEREETVAQVHQDLRQLKHQTSEGDPRDGPQDELQQQIHQLTEELEAVKEERSQLKSDMQENVEMMIENQEELRAAQEKIQKQKEVIQDLKTQILEIESKPVNVSRADDALPNLQELQDQIKQLSEELQQVCSERDALQSERTNAAHLSEEEQEKLRSHITSLTEERDQLQEILEGVREERSQLQKDLQEREETSVQTQAELLSAQEELKLQQELNSDLQAQVSESETPLQQQIKQLTEELQQVCSERDALQSERTNTAHLSEEDQEKLRSHITSLTEERDQLQEILEGVREERSQLQKDLQEREETVALVHEELRQQKHQACEHQDLKDSEQAELQQQIHQLTEELEHLKAEKSQLKTEAKESVEMMIENQEQLRAAQEKIQNQKEVIQDLKTQIEQMESEMMAINRANESLPNMVDLSDQIKQLSEELQQVCSERDALQSERTNAAHLSEEQQEKLRSHITSLTEERDQLQEILEGVREERSQLKKDLQEREEMVAQVHEDLRQLKHQASEGDPRDGHQDELQQQIHQLTEELEAVKEERSQLKSDMQENVEMMIENQEELRAAQEKIQKQKEVIQDLKTQNLETESKLSNVQRAQETLLNLQDVPDQIKQLSEELQQVCSERDALQSERTNAAHLSEEEQEKLRSHITSLTEERDQLQEILEGVREERSQLKKDLQEREETSVQIQAELLSAQEELKRQQQLNSDLQTQVSESETHVQQQMKQLSEELQQVCSERDALQSERTNTAHLSEEEQEKLRSHITSLTEERDQLQEILEGVREERSQLQKDLQEREETSVQTQAELLSAQEELKLQQQLNSDLQTQVSENETPLQQQIKQLSEELQQVCSERDALQSERTNAAHLSEEEQEKLRSHITSLTEERDQLQEILEGVREERSQLQKDLQEREETSVQTQAELLSAQEELKRQQQLNSDLQTQVSESETQVQQQIKQLSEELQQVCSERDALQSERTNAAHLSEEEQEKLRSHITSLTEERDQLQEILEGVREERSQLQKDLQEREETSVQTQAELLSAQEELKQQQQLNSDLQAQVSENETRVQQQVQEELRRQQLLDSEHQALKEREQAELQKQIQQLAEELEGVRDERTKLTSDLQESIETGNKTRDLLHSVQEELKEQQQLHADLKTQHSDTESHLEQKIKQLSEELQQVCSEREALQSERTNAAHLSEEEQEKLRSHITSLTEERDQLQEILEGVREERRQLKKDLQEREETVSQVQNQLLEQEHLKSEQQMGREKEQEEFQHKIHQLAEELEGVRRDSLRKAEQEKASRESLSAANSAISRLEEQIRDLEERSSSAVQAGESLRCRLESEQQMQKALEKFEQFADNSVGTLKELVQPLQDASLVEKELAFQILSSIPKPLTALYVEFRNCTDGINDFLWRIARGSAVIAKLHRQQMEAQASLDTACFLESRLQDLLIRTSQCPNATLSEIGGDLHQVWDQRLSELLDRREQKMQEMNKVLAELEEGMARNVATVSEELPELERTNKELRDLIDAPSLNLTALQNLLERERARRTEVLQNKKAIFLRLKEEHSRMGGDLKALAPRASQRLKEERSRSLTLLQKRQSGPAKSEADLLQSIQDLTHQLQQSESLVKMVEARAKELEEAQARAEDRVSKHKEATQLLQTELQDMCAQLKERESDVQGLKVKLQESEAQVKRGMAPTAVELEEMKNRLMKMELERTACASRHQEELEKVKCMLDHKEEALRKLKETLRKAQQQGDESFMEDAVHAKGAAPTGGRNVQNTVIMEKNRLEEEVKALKKKIVQLESLVSSQQLEVAKWKSRATKLKENKREGLKADAPLSPYTPTKRRRPVTSEGHILDSPKSKFFDACSVSESMSANCPTQFFDNSSLGNVPEVLYPPTTPAIESPESPNFDLTAAAEDKNAQWWPMSPSQADNCKTQ